MGPLATARRLVQLQALIDDAVARGARLVAGGSRAAGVTAGNYFSPTVLVDVPDDARIMIEESFGPVALVNSFTHADEVYGRANATQFGLAAYAFTRSLASGFEASERMEAGVVSINRFAASTTEIPFGGVKDSGYGRECGALGIREYLAAFRTRDVESENWPQRGQFLPDSKAHSPAMGREGGEKWTAAADLQPTFPKSDRLLESKTINMRF